MYNYKHNITIYEKIFNDIVNSNIYNTYNNYYNLGDIIHNIILYCDDNDITLLSYINDILLNIDNYLDNLSYLNFDYLEFYENLNFINYDINKINNYNKNNIYSLIDDILLNFYEYIN
jgi:hypothetical protein